MNAVEMAKMAYASPEAPVRTPRGIEAEAFVRVTGALHNASQAGRTAYPELVAALFDNRRLWNLLAASVADPENALSPQLRAQIFYLAEFTEKHSGDILRGDGDVDTLIDLNSIVLSGLREGDPTDAAGAKP